MPDTWQKMYIKVSGAIIGSLVIAVTALAVGSYTKDQAAEQKQNDEITEMKMTQVGYGKDFEFLKEAMGRIEKVVTEIKDKK